MHSIRRVSCAVISAAAMFVATNQTSATIIVVDYTENAGGSNPNPLNGMTARGTFELVGTTLSVLMENTGTGVPLGAEVSDSLLVSVAFSLPGGVSILSGDSAVIGPGSMGLGVWSGRGPGDSVAEQWLWTNDGGGDLLAAFSQVISTSQGQGGGTTVGFDGMQDPNVGGPFGGIAADPPQIAVPATQRAVSDSISFSLTLTGALTPAEFQSMVQNSIVEFGSDYQYLTVPGPAALPLLLLPAIAGGRRRRR